MENTNLDSMTRVIVICGLISAVTTSACALLYFTALFMHVYRNNQWPEWVTWGTSLVVLIGPVLTNWQFMGVRKLLSDVIGGSVDSNGVRHAGIADIAQDVVAARFGYVRKDNDDTPPNQPS